MLELSGSNAVPGDGDLEALYDHYWSMQVKVVPFGFMRNIG
jgi:hypothetical protein